MPFDKEYGCPWCMEEFDTEREANFHMSARHKKELRDMLIRNR